MPYAPFLCKPTLDDSSPAAPLRFCWFFLLLLLLRRFLGWVSDAGIDPQPWLDPEGRRLFRGHLVAPELLLGVVGPRLARPAQGSTGSYGGFLTWGGPKKMVGLLLCHESWLLMEDLVGPPILRNHHIWGLDIQIISYTHYWMVFDCTDHCTWMYGWWP